MKSCPADMEPYDRAHRLRVDEQNFMLWLNGKYVAGAIMSTIGNSGWFRGKGAPVNEYPKEPYSLHNDLYTTEDKKQQEVDKFFAQESVRKANWKRNRKYERI